ncbi:C40 family peptidase [Burkholderia anthina]|uniref:C40 family peptidase n=1 Tax=Burkholderia anthina TaxID=179879 RepID=UPI0037C10665
MSYRFNRFTHRAARTLAVLALSIGAMGTAHAIPHRTALRSTPIRIAVSPSAPSAYWQAAFNQPLTAALLIPMATPRPVTSVDVPIPDPGTFYAQDVNGNVSLFDEGSQYEYDAWDPVAPPKVLPNVRPGFATLALLDAKGPDGLPLPVALPAGPKVKPKNWRVSMISNARKFLGIPYVWGGNSPEQGMDCSGFVRWVTAMTLGKALPRLASQQSEVGTEVSKNDLKPGDLVFFDTKRGPATHVGIYVGNGTFINAPHTGAKIRYESLTSDYWEARWHGARRIG